MLPKASDVRSRTPDSTMVSIGGGQTIGRNGMVSTAFPSATEAAIEILQAGGNAIDAAMAAAWALAVCEPSGSGLGGQTILLIHLADGRSVVIDGHSHAPASVSRKCVTKIQQRKGYRACTIPSTPATLEYTQKHYGLLPQAKVMEAAIRLAEDGYAITKLQRRQMNWCLKDLVASPAAAKLFLKNSRPFRTGDIFQQKELAATLRRLADVGVQDFYQGDVARAIVEDMKNHGGLITEKDLTDFTLPVERVPLRTEYRGHQVVSAAPPGGGLQVLLGLNILNQFASDNLSDQTENWYALLAEVTHTVFRERDCFAVHPRDLTPSLLKWLLSVERAAEIAKRIEANCYEITGNVDKEEPGETTHLCTADSHGNVVALTQSIQSLFGAKVANGKLGFLYNNYLCTCKRCLHPYQLDSCCIPQSNAAPTLILRDYSSDVTGSAGARRCELKPFLTLGAAGSRRITSAILQVISGIIDRGISLEEAVASPRVHALVDRKVSIERPAAAETLLGRLERCFCNVRIKAPHSYSMGAVQAIQFREDRTLIGMADPRRDGAAMGF